LREISTNVDVIISTTTVTGQGVARKCMSGADAFIYFPFDISFFVRRSLRAVNPDVFVSVESEIWPNFLFETGKRNIPAILVNGIVSDKTFKRGMMVRAFYRRVLGEIRRFLMQTDADAERIISL